MSEKSKVHKMSFIHTKSVGRVGLFKGIRGATAQGHQKIGGTTLVDCRLKWHY